MTTTPKPVVLCILDGWGESDVREHNAIAQATTPNWDRLRATCPRGQLEASEANVGLPAGQMGNSEVGHMNIGAGRVVMQDLPRIDAAIADGTLAENAALKKYIAALQATGGTCHLMGLFSDGGVHSHLNHIAALANIIADAGVPVAVHAFTDGRDTPPRSALKYLAQFREQTNHHIKQPTPGRFLAAIPRVFTACPPFKRRYATNETEFLRRIKIFLHNHLFWPFVYAAKPHSLIEIASVIGRYYAMDRDKRWERIHQAYDAMVDGDSSWCLTAEAAIEYDEGKSDEFIEPVIIGDFTGMRDGDGLLMANFRADRARQLLHAFLDPAFSGFERLRTVNFATTLGMVEYSEALNAFVPAIFPTQEIRESLGELVSAAGMKQLRIAETEKYAHVTFFFNGGREDTFAGEDRILVPSPKVATYDLQPEMSAHLVTDKLVEAIESRKYDLIVVNYANTDMVGHSGDINAAMKAVEAVDQCLGRLDQAIQACNGTMLITADHGNAECLHDEDEGQPHTAHTLNPVPCILVGNVPANTPRDLGRGILADIAPTLAAILGLPVPAAMTGRNLLANAQEHRRNA